MRLEHALDIQHGEVISFIGAGGKTSALFRLGNELRQRGFRVLATTTTRIAVDELVHAPASVAVTPDLAEAATVSQALTDKRFVFVYDSIARAKVQGIAPETVSMLLDRVNSDVLLIEADGARRLPFKAPYDHEPVVPRETTRIVLSVGLDALGQPLDPLHIYNAEAMIARYGYPPGAPVAWPWVASVVRDEELGLANLPEAPPVYVLLNKVPKEGTVLRRARLIASLLLRSARIYGVVIGEMQALEDPVHEVRRPVAAIVLAAGMSSRMGKLKVLLPWGKQTVLDAIIRQLHIARLSEIVVVTGRESDRVASHAAQYAAHVVHNADYASGEMLSSLQAGLRALDSRVSAALVALGDQPQIQSYVVARMLDAYARQGSKLVIPSFQMRRGHPVLFDRSLWQPLLELPADGMPRDVVNAYQDQIVYVNVNTDSIIRDIDTLEDYRAALRDSGL
ncbi:MAG: putative selenium-dependent hydroxylase accessory protein YqeC [Anaerolineae bacterium]|nr:putative selenium-dependent hydroxylase accessory protein YqeC [Anaerolineae bacterium]